MSIISKIDFFKELKEGQSLEHTSSNQEGSVNIKIVKQGLFLKINIFRGIFRTSVQQTYLNYPD
jgi:hypothetical protein